MPDLAESFPPTVAAPAWRRWTGRLASERLRRSVPGPRRLRLGSGPCPKRTRRLRAGPRLHADRVRQSDRQARRFARPVVVVNFLASWCPPCREEAAYLERTSRNYQGRGVVFLGVDWVDTVKEARPTSKSSTSLTSTDRISALASRGEPDPGRPRDLSSRQERPGPPGQDRSSYPPELEDKIEELLAEPSADEAS